MLHPSYIFNETEFPLFESNLFPFLCFKKVPLNIRHFVIKKWQLNARVSRYWESGET